MMLASFFFEPPTWRELLTLTLLVGGAVVGFALLCVVIAMVTLKWPRRRR